MGIEKQSARQFNIEKYADGSTGHVNLSQGSSPVGEVNKTKLYAKDNDGVIYTMTRTNGVDTERSITPGGEANTGSSLGAGAAVFKQKTGVDLEFRSLAEGTNMSFTTGADTITINTTAEINTASNVGTGVGLYKQKTGVDFEFKSLLGSRLVQIDSGTNEITINDEDNMRYVLMMGI